jgi:hypothetical protein
MKSMLTLLSGLFCLASFAQVNPYAKFGKVSPQAFEKKVYSLDSSANAVVLSDVGEASIEGNSKGWFSVVTNRHKVVHILNKAGYNEATVEIPLYVNGADEEKLEELKRLPTTSKTESW